MLTSLKREIDARRDRPQWYWIATVQTKDALYGLRHRLRRLRWESRERLESRCLAPVISAARAASVKAGLLATTGPYGIKSTYVHRSRMNHWDDTGNTDTSLDPVYAMVRDFCREHGVRTVLDIGCGGARKLLEFMGEFDTTGSEVEPAISGLRQRHPDRKWIQSDFAAPPAGRFDVVMCVDVIEHLPDPDALLGYMQRLDFDYLFINTPVRAAAHNGPPANRFHMREWSATEFATYVGAALPVLKQTVFKGDAGQSLLCTKKEAPGEPGASRINR